MNGFGASPRMGFLLRAVTALPLVAMLGLAGCSDGSDSDKGKPTSPPAKDYLNAPAAGLVAVIRRTTNGVPYVKADNLESAAFAVGYAQAQDNACVLADAFVKARSERALLRSRARQHPRHQRLQLQGAACPERRVRRVRGHECRG